MANDYRLRGNFLSGTVTDNPLLVGATTMNSAGLAALPVIDATTHMAITFDPNGLAGAPEIAYITAHAAGATTATIVRAREGTGARQHAALTAWMNAPTALDYPTSRFPPQDRLWTPPAVPVAGTASALSDEFNDGALDSAWVRYDTTAAGSGPVVYTEGADCLNINHAGSASDNAGPAHALLRPLGGLTFPITIEAAFRMWRRYATNYQMLGVLFTDGTAQTSKCVWINPYASTNTATAWTVRTGTWNALNAGETASSPNVTYELIGGPMYQRLRWSAANTFQSWYSCDGVGWHKLPTADLTHTITPTHIGFAVSTWTINTPCMASVEYFRTTAV